MYMYKCVSLASLVIFFVFAVVPYGVVRKEGRLF